MKKVWLIDTQYQTILLLHLVIAALGGCFCPEMAYVRYLRERVSRQPVLDCGMIFHPDCGGRDFHSILSDDL